MSVVAIDPLAAVLAKGEDERWEFADGNLIPVSPPSDVHADEMGFLYSILRAYVQIRSRGRVMPDGYAQRIAPGIVRIPDVAFFRESSLGRMTRTHSEGAADFIVEIVSPESRIRDRRDKLFEYAKAGVEEYWIIDPLGRKAEFYRLVEGAYETVGTDEKGRAHSSVVPGFFVRLSWLWEQPTLVAAMRELGLI